MAFENKKIFDLDRSKKTPFPMDAPEIKRIKVVIRLSSAEYIPYVQRSLDKVLKDYNLKKKGNEITIYADPPRDNFGEDDILATVQNHDLDAVKIRKPSEGKNY